MLLVSEKPRQGVLRPLSQEPFLNEVGPAGTCRVLSAVERSYRVIVGLGLPPLVVVRGLHLRELGEDGDRHVLVAFDCDAADTSGEAFCWRE